MDIPGNSSEHPDSEDDCVIISNLLTKSTIRGYHYPKLTKEQYVTPEPPTKLMKPSLAIRNDLTTTAFLDFFHQNYVNSEYAVNDNVEIVKEPFKVCVVHNFLDDEAVLLKIQDEFNEIEWNKRSLDLYEFFQSKDLKDVHSYYVSCMYEFLKNDVKDWIQNLTGMEFVNISATCSLYTHTDYLLVHDDLQGSRAIAFVLYFSGPASWKTESGGALQLFEMDFVGEPSDVVRSIYPRNNQFVFFPVSTNSYHQVEEIVNREDCRMSINGWFHTVNPLCEKPPQPISNTTVFTEEFINPKLVDLDLESWIHPDYLDSETAESIQKQMEEESELSLHDFIKTDQWQQVVADLYSPDLEWDHAGPPNRRSCDVLCKQNLPDNIRQFIDLFLSHEMFVLLKNYTDLDFKHVRYELQRWGPQCYSLLSDYDWSNKSELDLVLYLGLPDTVPMVGGKTMYIAVEDRIEEALVTLDPQENCLNLVFRDTARITKYVSKCNRIKTFFMLICSYSE